MPFESPTNREEENTSIHETETKVSYLGVTLEKAPNREHAPHPEDYADYIDDQFSLELQQKIAVSFYQGDPLLIEAGTSIGKTTTVKKMCADLGWEVHYANLNGATDVEDLMGRYIPNPGKVKEGDPEYIFADGKVTSGLRQEEGKTKVVILDELNAAAPNILIRLHEVLDALERGGEVVLSEDASEAITVDKTKTKIIALMNPPGRGYLQREPLDPALLRRWVYQKEVTDLPRETFSNAVDVMFGLAPQHAEVERKSFMRSNEAGLSPELIAEIKGIGAITAKYKEFHQAAKELVRRRAVGADQPQPFTYDDRVEQRRVRDFVANFYRGDINQTFQDALRYYYVGKVLDQADKQKLEELLKHVEYTAPKADSKRKSLDKKNKDSPERVAGETEAEKMLGKAGEEITGLKRALRAKRREISGEESASVISAEYQYRDATGKEQGETIEIDFEAELSRAEKFYHDHEIEIPADFAEVMRDIWDRNQDAIREAVAEKGFDKVLLLPATLPPIAELEAKLTAGYEAEKGNKTYWWVKAGDIVKEPGGSRVVLVHQAPDLTAHPALLETLGKEYGGARENGQNNRAEDFIDAGERLALSEYLVLQREVFDTTGVHLDSKKTPDGKSIYWTWLPGSQLGGGRVVYANWDPDTGRLHVSALSADRSNADLGCRLSRQFS